MDDGEELELGTANGYRGSDRDDISEIKYTDLPFTTNGVGWSRKRYVAALIGKSARAAAGAYEYIRDGVTGGLGHRVEGLEPKESE